MLKRNYGFKLNHNTWFKRSLNWVHSGFTKQKGKAFFVSLVAASVPLIGRKGVDQNISENISPERQEELDDMLENAIEGQDVSRVKKALKAGANPNAEIYMRTYARRLRLEVLVKRPVSFAIARMESYNKQVMEEIIKELIAAGADVNDKGEDILNPNSESPLLCEAAATGNKNVVKMLLDAGACANVMDKFDESAVYHAVWRGNNIDTVEVLIERGALVHIPNARNPLIPAIQRNNNAMIRFLIKHGAPVNEPKSDGETLLHFAVGDYRNEEAIIALIEGGADVNAQTRAGLTSLDDAKERYYELLRSYGAKTSKELKEEQELKELALLNKKCSNPFEQ